MGLLGSHLRVELLPVQSDTAGLSASIFLSVLGSAALVGLSRVAHNGTDAEASLTCGRRPSGVGG